MRKLGLFLALVAFPAAGQEKWTPELSMRVRSIAEALPSPDGRWLVYAVSEAVMEETVSEIRAHLRLARTDGSRDFRLTRGEAGAAAPRFSADSRFVYFRSERGESAGVWRIAVDGGEAEAVTTWEGDLGPFAVSPDGSALAFIGREKGKAKEDARERKTDWRVVDEHDENRSLWLVSLKDGSEEEDPRRLTGLDEHVAEIEWAPDSERLAVVVWPSASADRWTQAELREIDRTTGDALTVGGERRAARNPAYSPDGRRLAFQWSRPPVGWAGECVVGMFDRQGGNVQDLPELEPDRCGRGTALIGWTGDGAKLLYTASDRTRNVLRAITLNGRQETLFAPARGTIGGPVALDSAGKRLGFSLESSTEAPEAHFLEIGSEAPKKLSAVNAELTRPPLGRTELVHWRSPDGLDVEGLLTYPVGYEEGRRYPLVLVIHGGPMGVFQETFIGGRGLYPIAAFAAEGFAVLRPNPRGSSGYGKRFRRANYGDWGGGDYEDVMSGVDRVIAMGVVDPERMAVMGWSYGGYMTSWIIGHTDRFRAAAAGAAVTNLWSFNGVTDIGSFLPDYFSGEPWERFEAYVKHSPLRYADKVSTPTLILHGEADERVPISQGYELFQALRRRGVETEMVVYPRQPHGPREPKFVLDVMRRHLEWARKAR